MTVEGEVLDACVGGCGGIWFDRYELTKVDEAHEFAGEPLLYIEISPDTSALTSSAGSSARNAPAWL